MERMINVNDINELIIFNDKDKTDIFINGEKITSEAIIQITYKRKQIKEYKVKEPLIFKLGMIYEKIEDLNKEIVTILEHKSKEDSYILFDLNDHHVFNNNNSEEGILDWLERHEYKLTKNILKMEINK